MKKLVVTASLVALALVPLRADVTIVQTMTMEGPMAAMAGGQLPKITTRIKGTKARSDVDSPALKIVSIADLALNQVVILNSQTMTAQVMTPESVAAAGGLTKLQMPDIDASLKPTGKSQTIDGQVCHEHLFSMSLKMAEMSGQGQLPPEAAEMMKDVTMAMNGSMWIAKDVPGTEEYMAYIKSATKSGLGGVLSGMKPGQNSAGLEKLMAAVSSAPGVPLLTEITMTVEGTGPMVDAMKQMGPMKMIQKTSSISTDAIPDDLFKIPEGYTIQK